jgi:MFS family permease
MQSRFAMMFSLTSLASAFSGLLAFAIQHLDGKHGIPGWKWIFIIVSLLLLSSHGYLSPTPSPRRELSLAPLALQFFISSPLHPETSKFSLRKRKMHIAEILPMIGVVTPTPMANIRRNSVGAKSLAHS